MCGRYTMKSKVEEIDDIIPGKFQYPLFSPSYNIAPSQGALITTFQDQEYAGEIAKWGLIPHWMKNPKKPFINARSETIFEKPSFKYLYPKNRCVVIADGFYEWAVFNDVKRPVYFRLPDGRPFGFAGYWEWDREEKGKRTFVIMTTEANETLKEFHHRMPVMLEKDDIGAWLEDGEKSVLRSYQEEIVHDVVSRIVNSPANNNEECIKPIADQGEEK